MYLTFNETRILSALKKAQSSLNSYVLVDLDGQKAYCCSECSHTAANAALEKEAGIKIKASSAEIEAALSFFREEGFLKRPAFARIYQVTYDGWRNRSLRRHEILTTVVTHFLFPSLVAFVTTIVTLFML